MENWRLNYNTKCYNCGVIADQIIEIYSNQAFVKCSNCEATRYYIIKKADIEDSDIIETEKKKKRRYDNWILEKKVECYNCNALELQDILITESGLYVRCRNCGFTRYYRYHMMDIPKK
ncbi:MAG: hypothetical protein PWP15_852 [Methanothermococcus sp.]|jgi:transcription elongation factor Elf1|uniref:hypothetical protein n=1 Tax=Methanothermococcus TaxID=155862 RepID=UPI00036042E9|nr:MULTISPECIES: hypothetical protein [Methanothermococcus]MDK2790345.1 hypothetical protein [Methanothermococcus sp.]MDK2987688.1 hypothetical protein [Methanothermococcus sp.]